MPDDGNSDFLRRGMSVSMSPPVFAIGGRVMEFLRWAARLAGLIGVVLTLLAGLSRLSGRYSLGTYQAITVL